MLNIIQNTIGAIRRVGESVVRAGLKMWLPFTKSEPLGVNVVTDGSFNDTSEWIKENGWVVSGGLATRTDVDSYTALQQSCLVSGTTYIVTIVVDSITSGNIFGIRLGTNYILQGGLSVGTHTATGTANGNVLSIMGNPDFAGTISSISIQEYAQETPDISGNDNNAILKTGKALVFSGNDSVETSFPSSKTIKTIAFWIYPTHSNTGETLFYFGGSSYGARFLHLNHLTLISDSYNNTNFNVYIDGVARGETNTGGNNPTLVINEWQRVVLTSSTDFNTTLNTLDVASKGFGSDGRFKMADLQIYGAEFTTDDIAYDYANPQSLVTDNASSNVTLNDLHAWWHMSEGDGTIAFDSAPLIGKELFTNGDFATDGTLTSSSWALGWASSDNDGTNISDGVLSLINDDDGAFDGRAYATNGSDAYLLLDSDKTYAVTYTISENTNNASLNFYFGSYTGAQPNTVGTHTVYHTQSGGALNFIVRNATNNTTIKFSSISAKEVFNIDGETYDGSSLGATYDDAQERIPQLGMMNWSKGSNVLTYSNDFQASSWSSPYVVFDDGYEAPDGTMTALKLTRDGTPGFGAVYDQTVTPNIGVVRSIYAKTVSGTGNIHLMNNNGNANSLVTVTNEWQRFSISSEAVAAGNFYAVDFRGSSTLTEVILWGAQEEVNVGDSLSAFRKTDGTAVTDATLISCATDSQKDILGNAVRVKGSGFNLDGTGYAEVLDDNDFDIPAVSETEGDFSICGWAKWKYVQQPGISTMNTIFSNGNTIGVTNTFSVNTRFDGSNNKVRAYVNGSHINSTTTYSVGEWFYFALTRKKNAYTNNITLYVSKIDSNGDWVVTSEDVGTNNDGCTNSNDKTIGWDSTVNDRKYYDLIDDIKFYDRELSLDEIEQNFNATKSGHNN